jgi:RimJ/RimL family protein N-acetyltransferase
VTPRVRAPVPADAAGVNALIAKLYSETDFMLYEPGEWQPTEAEQAQHIERMAGGPLFVCEAAGAIVGMVFGIRGSARRTRHSLVVVIGVAQAWVGRGIGRALLEALEGWGRANGLHRLELNVDSTNARAIALYEKFGFRREGLRRHSRKLGERYGDELLMAKLLGEASAGSATC